MGDLKEERMSDHVLDQTWARYYDESLPPGVAEVAPVEAEFLAEIAGSGPAVEIGIGTGRVGLELVRRGVEVIGVDSSPAMIEQLQRKPHADQVRVIIGDFLEVDIPGPVPLVYCTFGSLFQLGTQQGLLRSFEIAKDLLAEGGRFVVEVPVPDLSGFVDGQRIHVDRSADGTIKLIGVERHEAATQLLVTEIIMLHRNGSYDVLPLTLRYAYPDELDLMARHAGLTLLERWSNWHRSPFTVDSQRHISVYG